MPCRKYNKKILLFNIILDHDLRTISNIDISVRGLQMNAKYSTYSSKIYHSKLLSYQSLRAVFQTKSLNFGGFGCGFDPSFNLADPDTEAKYR